MVVFSDSITPPDPNTAQLRLALTSRTTKLTMASGELNFRMARVYRPKDLLNFPDPDFTGVILPKAISRTTSSENSEALRGPRTRRSAWH
jgi:hypothetical protein